MRLWTLDTGIVQSDRAVLETLAAANVANSLLTQTQILKELPDLPVVWLSHRNDSIGYLPLGSRWILWQPSSQLSGQSSAKTSSVPNQRSLGLTIETISDSDDLSYKSLRSQLQEYLEVH